MTEESPRHDPRSRKREGWIAVATVLMLLAFLAFQQMGVRGFVFPVRVAEGSMAPTLAGEHFLLKCQQCATSFQADLSVPSDHAFVCPHCETRFIAPENSLRLQQGDRVLIHRWNAWIAPIERWQMIAAKDPRKPSRFIVKRIVGLPGEEIMIDHGNVFVDRQLVSKSLEQLRELSVEVDDEQYSDESGESSWRTENGDDSRWVLGTSGWTCDASRLPESEWEWLQFHPKKASDERLKILDNYGYNQDVSRRLNVVSELLVTCELQADLKAELCLEFSQVEWGYRLVLSPSRRSYWIEQNGTRLQEKSLPPEGVRRVEFAICDGQLLTGINDQSGMTVPMDVVLPKTTPVPRIGIRHGSASLSRLSVDRDLFYLRQLPEQAPQRLAADEYFLLGDNSPISVDSRDPELGPIRQDHVLGTVTRWAVD